MKKTLAIVGLAFSALSGAHAENRLFPTDILDQGEVDARVSVGHDTHSSNINFNGNPGHSSMNETSESLQVRYGLGSNWHIGLAIPYRSHSEVNTDYTNPAFHRSNTSGKGDQNLVLWATYGILYDKASPLSLSAEVLITPDTAGKAKSSYMGRITGGWKSSDMLRLYTSLSATTFDDSSAANSYALRAGAYIALSESLTLIPQARYVRFESTDTMSSYDQPSIGMSANIRLTDNSYLIPDLEFYKNGAAHSTDGLFHRDASNNGKAFSLGLYHLF